MKKFILFSVLILLIMQGFAQPSKRTSAWNYLRYNELEKAKKAIDEASQHEQTKEDAKTWYYRGQVYFRLDTNSSFSSVHENPLKESLASFEKCLKLDAKKKYAREVKGYLANIGLKFFNRGVKDYNKAVKGKENQYYASALEQFESYIKVIHLMGNLAYVLENHLKKNGIEPSTVYLYAGYSARVAGAREKAEKYFMHLLNEKYDDPVVYKNLAEIQMLKGDTAQALNILDIGKGIVSNTRSLRMKELKIYKDAGRVDELIEKLNEAIESEPGNITLYLVLAQTYDQLRKKKKAIQTYKEALKVNPQDFNVNYNLGVLYYNIGVDTIKASQGIKNDYKKVGRMQEKAKSYFKKALPYLEKAFNRSCKDPNVFKTLQVIYGRLAMNSKVDALEKRYQNKKITVSIQGTSGAQANITIEHSGTTQNYKNMDLPWSDQFCLSGKNLNINVEVTSEGGGKTLIQVIKGSEVLKKSSKKSLSYSLD